MGCNRLDFALEHTHLQPEEATLLAPGAIVLCHDAAYAPTRRGIDRAVREGGFADCGDLVASPVWTEDFENGERVLWGGLRMLRRS